MHRRLSVLLAMVTMMVAMLALAGVTSAQITPQPVDPPERVAQLRQQFEGLTAEQIQARGYVPHGPCIPNPEGPGAMGVPAINEELMQAQFPSGTMDPADPPVLLLDRNNTVVGVEWEAADVGQGPMEMFGQTIELQPGHPGAEDPHYMLHIYFKADGKVIMGGNGQMAFDPELSCPPMAMPETGGIVSPLQIGGILFALVGGFAGLGLAFVARQRLS